MKAVVIALAPMLAFGGCEDIRARLAMKRELFEPFTASYSAFAAPAGNQAKAPPIICGDVRAKNHHGYYTSDQKYVLDRKTGEAAFQNDLMLIHPRNPKTGDWPREARFLRNWDSVCQRGTLTYTQLRQAFDWLRSPDPSDWDWTFWDDG